METMTRGHGCWTSLSIFLAINLSYTLSLQVGRSLVSGSFPHPVFVVTYTTAFNILLGTKALYSAWAGHSSFASRRSEGYRRVDSAVQVAESPSPQRFLSLGIGLAGLWFMANWSYVRM